MSFASVTLLGHVGRDPEMSYTPDGTAVCKFSIATNHKVKNQDVTTWWNCTAWRGLGETINAHVHKGDMLLVIGSPSLREYTRRDGGTGSSLDVIVDKFAFAGGKKSVDNVTPLRGGAEEALPGDDPLGDLEDHPF
jgi:single-strand DNA-binding protein